MIFTQYTVTEGLEREIFLKASFSAFPQRRYNEMMRSLGAVVRYYDRLGKRNHKKEMIADYERRFAEAEAASTLPDNPDMEAIGRFAEKVNVGQ